MPAIAADTLRIDALSSAYREGVAALDRVFNAAPFDTLPVVLAGGDAHIGCIR